MGIKHLALVGTHEDYAAHVFEPGNHGSICYVSKCASAHDAAQSYMASIISDYQGLFRELAIKVWPIEKGKNAFTVFTVKAVITPCVDPDAEEGEFEACFELDEWPKN